MRIDEIKRLYSVRIIEAITGKDGSGKGYICPFCGSGSGKKGTGIGESKDKAGNPQPGKYHCFDCEWTGDGLDMIGKVYGIDNVIDQVKKAETLLHIPLLDTSEREAGISSGSFKKTEENKVFSWEDTISLEEPEKVKTNDIDNKNDIGINDNLQKEIIAEMEAAKAALPGSERAISYLLARGISQDTAIKNNLGYIDNYGREGMNGPAIMIPDSNDSYTARSMIYNESSRKVRKRKGGERQGFFNIGIMEKPPLVIYLVEGQFDALSIIEAGSQAIATGGQGKNLPEELLKYGKKPYFIVLPDNDRNEAGRPDLKKGYSKGKRLQEALQAAGFNALFINTSNPEKWPADIKDANEYLVKDRAAFIELIRSHAQIIEDKLLGRVSGFLQEFIDQAAGSTPPIASGFNNLDKALEGGLHAGLIVVGAISSLGKTTWALNLAENMAAAGQDVLFISLEMSRFELISKLISKATAEYCLQNQLDLSLAKTNLGISDFTRYNNYSRAEMDLIQNCFKKFKDTAAKHLYIREGIGNIGTAEIKKYIEIHKEITGRTPVLIVDYLQILAPADAHSTDKQNTDKNTVELKRISRDYNTPVLAISSFNRENYLAPVNMAAFKESGSVEYSSDLLLALQYLGMDYVEGEKATAREERIRQLIKENKIKAKKGQPVHIQLKILKNRSGSLSEMGFNYYPMFNLYHAVKGYLE